MAEAEAEEAPAAWWVVGLSVEVAWWVVVSMARELTAGWAGNNL